MTPKTKREYKLPKTPIQIFYLNGIPYTFEIIAKPIGNTVNIQLVFNKLEEL